MPQWVIDYVLLHELAHLLVAGHDAAFWRLLEAYPETERAKAFLDGSRSPPHAAWRRRRIRRSRTESKSRPGPSLFD